MRASELARLVGGELHGADRDVKGVAPLDTAGPEHCAFSVGEPPADSAAGVLLASAPRQGRCTVVCDDPKLAFIELLEALFPEEQPQGIQPGAHVHPSAQLGSGVVIHAGAWVGPNCEIGDDCVIFPNAVLYPGTVLEAGVRVHAGAVIGADGFSLHPTPAGPRKLPHIGGVRVGAGSEIGANSCIDRAFLEETRLGRGCQLDNLVQVGHNAQLGQDVVVAGQSGISGSAVLGDGVVLGGQVGVADHVSIGPGARLAARTAASRDLPGDQDYFGVPARVARKARRALVALRHLPRIWRQVRDLEQRVGRLEEDLNPPE